MASFLDELFGSSGGLEPHLPTGTGGDNSGDVNPAALLAGGNQGIKPRPAIEQILGTVFDSILQAHRRPAIYGPGIKEQQQNEALQGFTTSPMQAIQRLSSVDPKLAIQLYGMAQRGQGTQAKAQSQIDYNKVRTLTEQAKLYGPIAAFASTITDQKSADHIVPIIQAKAKEFGLTIPEYDPKDPVGWGKQIQGMGTDSYKQARLELMGRQEDNREDNTASMIASRGARTAQGNERLNETNPNEVLGKIYEKIARGEKITPGERNLYNDNMRGKIASGRNSRTNATKVDIAAGKQEGYPSLPPRKAGDIIHLKDDDGNVTATWRSTDGKHWVH